MDQAIKPTVIGFGGSALSGKSYLSHRVAQALGWPRTSFGEHVREIARARGLEPNRVVLQSIGEELIQTDVKSFCRAVLARTSWIPGRPAVLDGVRHASVHASLREIVRPQPFVLVLVTAPESVRKTRLADRHEEANGTLETASITDIDQHSTEREVRTLLPSVADLVVESSDGGGDRVRDILHWLEARFPVS